MEGCESTADSLIAVSEEIATDQVHDAGDDTQDTEGPAQPVAWDDCTHGKRVDQASKTRTSSRDAHSDTAALVEPLWSDANTAHKEEAHAPTKADALAQEDMPFESGKG